MNKIYKIIKTSKIEWYYGWHSDLPVVWGMSSQYESVFYWYIYVFGFNLSVSY